MATGDSNDILQRLKGVLPRWFGDSTPILDALLRGLATTGSFVYSLWAYAKLQTRIKTATDGWLDMIAADFFGSSLVRAANQRDASFRARIIINLFRERATRAGIVKVLQDLTGRTPVIFEPQRPLDTGAYGAAVAVSQPGYTTVIDDFGIMRYVPPNTPRYQSGQLLIEKSSANLMAYSGQFNNNAWSKLRAAYSSTTATAPDGNSTGNKIVEDSTLNNNHIVYQSTSVTTAFPYTASIFMKAGERTKVRLVISVSFPGNAEASFDVSAGTIITTGAGATSASITPVGNGWFRCTVTATANATGTGNFNIYLQDASGNLLYNGDGSSGLYVWGAQLEQGSFATSYIPTNNAPVTRTADALLQPMQSSGLYSGYGMAGGYGSLLLPCQAFVTTYRQVGTGIPNVAGYGIPTGGYGVASQAVLATMDMAQDAVTDDDIYAAVDSVKPAGTTLWTRITS